MVDQQKLQNHFKIRSKIFLKLKYNNNYIYDEKFVIYNNFLLYSKILRT